MTIETILNSDMSVAYITDCATSPVYCATSPYFGVAFVWSLVQKDFGITLDNSWRTLRAAPDDGW